jgi:hypothetical protein
MSTIYSIGYSTLIFSKLFTIQRGKVKLFEGIFLSFRGGKGAPFYLFIYSFIHLSKMTLNFWILASLTTCHFPKSWALAKMFLACAKGLGSGLRGSGIFWKRLILVSIHNYLNTYMRIFWARKLNLVARITGKLLDGRSEQFWENWQSKKFYITRWKSNFNLIDTRCFLDWGWTAWEC